MPEHVTTVGFRVSQKVEQKRQMQVAGARLKNVNRITLPREVPRQENARNLKVFSVTKSGIAGVGRWPNGLRRAFISSSGHIIQHSRFENKRDAVIARKAAERTLGYHENHGRRARATIYRDIEAGRLPAPTKIGGINYFPDYLIHAALQKFNPTSKDES